MWRSGEAPRAIAWLPDGVSIGAPTAEGVPLLAAPSLGWSYNSGADGHPFWALVRVLPIPATAPADPPPLDPAGWKMVRGYRPFKLLTCSKGAPGYRFTTRTGNVTSTLTYGPVGAFIQGDGAIADLRVSEAGICVAGFFGSAHSTVSEVDQYGTMFVRADLAGGRAEMGSVDDKWGNMGSQAKEATCRPPYPTPTFP